MCNDCPICMEPLFPKTSNIMRLKKKVLVKRGEKLPITKLKCGHMYHNKCIKDWFNKIEVESSTKCPMCRENIRFKPDSKDFMMHKIRYNDPDYEYGDEYLYEIDTNSDYDDDNWSVSSENLRRVFPLDEEMSEFSDYDDTDEEVNIEEGQYMNGESYIDQVNREWADALQMML